MSNKAPQSTATLVKRLRRVAKWLDQLADDNGTHAGLFAKAQLQARANTCWQAAGRLEDLGTSDGNCIGPCGDDGHPLTCNCFPEEW